MVKLKREVQLKHASHLVAVFGYSLRKCNIIMKKHIGKLAQRNGLFSKVAYLKWNISPFVPHHGSRRYKIWKYSITKKMLAFREYPFLHCHGVGFGVYLALTFVKARPDVFTKCI